MTNETLSDKIYCSICGDKGGRKRCSEDILSKDVKEFIKRLKGWVISKTGKKISLYEINREINQIFGDKVTK